MPRKTDTGTGPMTDKGLKRVFSELHDHLYAQSNMSRNERLGKELLKIILAKYFDERLGTGIFPEHQEEVLAGAFAKRFRRYFRDTLSPRLVNAGVYSKRQALELDDRSLDFVGGVLAGSNFSESPVDVLGSAFEVFAEGSLAGDQGQFFTPMEVVRMAVTMMAPVPGDRVIDPACGSGGFLNLSTRWLVANGRAKGKAEMAKVTKALKRNIYGIDKDADLVEVARGAALVTGRSPDHILRMDSLGLLVEDPDGLLGTFDLVLTNPPFGTKIKITDKDLLKRYDLGHRWRFDDGEGRWVIEDEVQEREPQVLFMEVCMRLLKEGGRCAIVLPDGLFGNPTFGWVRQYVLDRAEVLAVVDCPHDTFMPATHTKTSVLFFRKRARPRRAHDIFMSIVHRCGHDSRGTMLLDALGKVDEEFSSVSARYKAVGREGGQDRLGFLVRRSELVEEILVPTYYDPELKRTIEMLDGTGEYDMKTFGELEAEGIVTIRNAPVTISKQEYGTGEVPFVRTTDIGNDEILSPTTHSVSREVYEMFKGRQDLRAHDILLIKDGTYRVGRSVMLLQEDLVCLVQSHFKIIRVNENDLLDPFVLYHLLQQPIVMEQIVLNTFVQATLSTIGRRIANIVLPIPKDPERRKRISDTVRKGLTERRRILAELRSRSLEE